MHGCTINGIKKTTHGGISEEETKQSYVGIRCRLRGGERGISLGIMEGSTGAHLSYRWHHDAPENL